MTHAKDVLSGGKSQRRGWIHFGIIAGILAVTAIGFEWTIAALKIVTQKQSIPWPEGVIIDANSFRWANMPEQVGGRFFLVGDGEFSGGEEDGVPDGERILMDDVLDSLKIGTGFDKGRIPDRCSNWHVVRIYRDNSVPVGQPFRYWHLEVYYYTGGMDTVPHIPERCMQAAGARSVGSSDVNFRIPGLPSPWWDQPVKFRRSRFELYDDRSFRTQEVVEYYVFSLNGVPETSWENVRLQLTKPWVRYCYFAKVQFTPLGGGTRLKELDLAAEEFMGHFLPVILRALPMPSDIEALKSTEKAVG